MAALTMVLECYVDLKNLECDSKCNILICLLVSLVMSDTSRSQYNCSVLLSHANGQAKLEEEEVDLNNNNLNLFYCIVLETCDSGLGVEDNT